MKTLLIVLSILFIGCGPGDSYEETNFSVNTGDPIYGDCVDGGEDCSSSESQEVID